MSKYFEGNKIIHVGMYDAVYMKNHPRTLDNDTVYVHVLVAEKILGRYLKPDETVHHKDFNKRNNDELNIMIFATSSSHAKYHMALRYNIPHKLINNDGVYECILNNENKNLCKICGTSLSSNKSVLCNACYLKEKSKHIPDKDILSDLITSYSFEEIGRKYNVSGKAVRRWCDKYGIKKQTFYIVPDKNLLISLLLKYSRKQVAKMYGVDPGVVENWEKKYNLKFTTDLRVKCLELDMIFNTKKQAAEEIYPNRFYKNAIKNIVKACETGCSFENYHWVKLPKELINVEID